MHCMYKILQRVCMRLTFCSALMSFCLFKSELEGVRDIGGYHCDPNEPVAHFFRFYFVTLFTNIKTLTSFKTVKNISGFFLLQFIQTLMLTGQQNRWLKKLT